MAHSKSTISASLMFFTYVLLLTTNVKSDSYSFSFPSFEPGVKTILVDGDAKTTDGVLQLTNKDQYGNPTPQSVGLSAYSGVVHISDTKSGKVADFTTEFTFVVYPKGEGLHGDGFTFFLASLDFDVPDNSTGGFLGLFNEETAFNTSKNNVVAVEFDSFANQWDPNFPTGPPHIGIDVNSLSSVATAPWLSDTLPQGAIGKATIDYDSYSKQLKVFVTYPNSPAKRDTTLSYAVNIAAALQSEWVLVGFSGTTGELVETHDILSWSFTSSL